MTALPDDAKAATTVEWEYVGAVGAGGAEGEGVPVGEDMMAAA